MENGKEDRISGLPDCLLLEILSWLPSIKYAIRTGTLSKRWGHLWTLLPTLIFTDSDVPWRLRLDPPYSRFDFVQLVEKTLTQCRQLKLKIFEMQTTYDGRFESDFNNWIRHAISCNVEELNLEFRHRGKEAEFQLDQMCFINSCFTDLRLVGCTLNPSGAISWKNLRSLCISNLNLDEDLIVNILSGSPVLETLVLENWHGSRRLDTTSHDSSDDESEANIIDINAPNSLSLTQCRQLKLKKFEVFSDFDIHFGSKLNSWIRYVIICNVKEIYLRSWNKSAECECMSLDQTLFTGSCFTDLTLDGRMVNPVGAISWKNLRNLCIYFGSLDEDLIENILSGSPVLETLVLEDCYGFRLLDITSKSVKNLVLSGYRDFYDECADIVEINAPNIKSLTIQQELYLWKLLLLNVSSLDKANLNYTYTKIHRKEVEQEMLQRLIMNLCHVKELNIGSLCSKVLSSLQAKGFIFPPNVKLPEVSKLNPFMML